MKEIFLCLIFWVTFSIVYAQQKMPHETTFELIRKKTEMGAGLQRGKVVGYDTYFVSQPNGALPDVSSTESTLNLRLQISPSGNSQIKFININFIKDTTIYPACFYNNTTGYATKPLSHYSLIMDVLKTKLAKGYAGSPITIQLTTGAPSGDILSIE